MEHGVKGIANFGLRIANLKDKGRRTAGRRGDWERRRRGEEDGGRTTEDRGRRTDDNNAVSWRLVAKDNCGFRTCPMEFRLWRTPCGGFHRVKIPNLKDKEQRQWAAGSWQREIIADLG